MKTSFFLLITLFFYSCNNDIDDSIKNEQQNTNRELAFLKVNFQTNIFEGANLFTFNNIPITNEIPLTETYITVSDLTGNITLTHSPTNQVIFDEPIRWFGWSNEVIMDYPATDFNTISNNAIIDLNSIQYFIPTRSELESENYTNFDYSAVWNAVKNLEITNDYINNNGKVAFFLYTPGLGLFNPESAKWFVLLYK